MEYIRRKIEDKLLWAMDNMRVVYLSGARQVGKSELVKQIAKSKGVGYITFDDDNIREFAQNNSQLFFSVNQPPIVIDEVQKAASVISQIKLEVDQRQRKGDFLLTGSVSLLSISKLSESLAGRIVFLTLYPFSVAEVKKWKFNFVEALFSDAPFDYLVDLDVSSYQQLIRRLLLGGFPENYFSEYNAVNIWFEGYLQSRIKKDILQLTERGLYKMGIFDKLLRLLAHQAGNLLNINNIAQDLKVHHTTAKSYFTLLENIYLAEILPSYRRNIAKRVVKMPKVYFVDTGLLSYLLGMTENKLIYSKQDYLGQILENYVYLELRKHLSFFVGRYGLFYYRDLKQNEVDFIIENQEGELVAIEVKSKSNILSSDLKGLKAFLSAVKQPVKNCFIIYGGQSLSALKLLDRTIYLIPALMLV